MKRRSVLQVLVLFVLLLLGLVGAVHARKEGLSDRAGRSVFVEGAEQLPQRGDPSGVTQRWAIETVDAPKTFTHMGARSLVVDAAGHPHIAYGGDRLYYAWHDGTAWHLETVDPSDGVGRYTSLVLDASGHPHIGYYNALNKDLKYACRDGMAWQIETVDSSGDVGEYASLALDTADRPHISYYDTGNDFLKYAYYDGTAWQIETVDHTGGKYPSLVLDQADLPHISYAAPEWISTALKYAYHDGSTWRVEVVSGVPRTWVYNTSLVLDASGLPHISYHREVYPAVHSMMYAYHDGTAWHPDTVGVAAGGNSLALDASGRPHIGYSSPSGLQYAYHDGTTWQADLVDDSGDWPSLVLDAQGLPHLSYARGRDLQYADHDGTAWHTEVVDSGGDVGRHTSLSLDANEHPHISYYDAVERDLRYAWYDGLAWRVETVDSGPDVGKYTSLALDPAGHPHISYLYYNEIGRYYYLKYAYHDGTSWHIEGVGGTSMVDLGTSLALDASGHPHVSYYADGNLYYAHHDGTAWQAEVVETSAGKYPSLVLDEAGRPHISYVAGTDIKYAYHDGTTWQIDTVGLWVGSGSGQSSLVLDAAGLPRVSYYLGSPAYDLMYAFYNGDIWVLERVDGGLGYCAAYPSMALDTADRPNVSYYDAVEGSLKFARRSGTVWQVEIVDTDLGGAWFLGGIVGHTSLALDAAGSSHIAYYNYTNGDLVYAFGGGCEAVEEVTIGGPPSLSMGITGQYSATYTPLTATLPVVLAWDNGSVGSVANYSWPVTGTHTLSVIATNECGEAQAGYTVTVFCQPVEEVAIEGLLALLVGQTGTYEAVVQPITASRPLTFAWDNGSTGPTAAYSWAVVGMYDVDVSAANACGEGQATLSVRVLESWPYEIYLPLLVR